MSATRHTILGLFFLAAVGLLGYYTLFRADFNPFEEQHELTVYFEDGGGLREGDAILVAGMRWGKVKGLAYDARETDTERRIRADLLLDQRVLLYQDHEISIEDSSILGGKVLRIEPGNPSTGDHPGGQDLYGSVPGNPFNQVADLIEENRDSLRSTLTDLSALMADARSGKGVLGALFSDEELRTNLTESVASVRTAFDNFDRIAVAINEGDGTISKLIKEDGVYQQLTGLGDSLTNLSNDLRAVVDNVQNGKGVVGALLNDETMTERLRTTMDDIAAISSRLRLGEGTIGQLLTDSTIADNLKELSVALTEGDGTIRRLIFEGDLYASAQGILDDLAKFSDSLANGTGTLPRLMNDDEIYVQLSRALATLTGTLEEAREAAPISAFLSLGFQGF